MRHPHICAGSAESLGHGLTRVQIADVRKTTLKERQKSAAVQAKAAKRSDRNRQVEPELARHVNDFLFARRPHR